MSNSQLYLSHLYRGSDSLPSLSYRDTEILISSIKYDSADFLYSSIISIGDALNGIIRNLFTWATVKLYYSVFYALRARLTLNDICLFYIGTKPYSIHIRAGEVPRKEKGQTHKIVIELFKRHNLDTILLSQPIDSEEPLEWLMRLREEANYKISRFSEPGTPNHFQWLSKVGIRQACETYLTDESYMYAFDKDHAMLAYPLCMIKSICSEFRNKNIMITNEQKEFSFLRSLFSDEKGSVSCLLNLFNF